MAHPVWGDRQLAKQWTQPCMVADASTGDILVQAVVEHGRTTITGKSAVTEVIKQAMIAMWGEMYEEPQKYHPWPVRYQVGELRNNYYDEQFKGKGNNGDGKGFKVSKAKRARTGTEAKKASAANAVGKAEEASRAA